MNEKTRNKLVGGWVGIMALAYLNLLVPVTIIGAGYYYRKPIAQYVMKAAIDNKVKNLFGKGL